MRGLFAPDQFLNRVLLVESASREVGNLLLRRFYMDLSEGSTVDVLTCYAAQPEAFNDARGCLYSVHRPEAVTNRSAFLKALARGRYDAVVIPCSGSGVLAKWKWALAAQTKSRIIFADESGDWFFLSLRNLSQLSVLAVRRMHLASIPQALLLLAKWIAAPFTVLWLVLFAVSVHAKRFWNKRRNLSSRTLST